MARQTKQNKPIRKQYSGEYMTEALALAARVGVTAAAQQVGLHESQLYAWHVKARREQGQSEAEQQLVAENARLKRQLADQAEELAIIRIGGRLTVPPLRHHRAYESVPRRFSKVKWSRADPSAEVPMHRNNHC